MSSDDIVETIAIVLMLAQVGAFVWSGILRKGIAPVLVLNLVTSGAVVLDWARRIRDLSGYIELVWVFVGFELVVFITSIVALTRARVPRAVIWVAFAAHTLLIAATLVFMFTFKLDRLI